jgi:hypothetical protein
MKAIHAEENPMVTKYKKLWFHPDLMNISISHRYLMIGIGGTSMEPTMFHGHETSMCLSIAVRAGLMDLRAQLLIESTLPGRGYGLIWHSLCRSLSIAKQVGAAVGVIPYPCTTLLMLMEYPKKLVAPMRLRTQITSPARISRNAKIVHHPLGRNLEMLVTAGPKKHILFGRSRSMGRFQGRIKWKLRSMQEDPFHAVLMLMLNLRHILEVFSQRPNFYLWSTTRLQWLGGERKMGWSFG